MNSSIESLCNDLGEDPGFYQYNCIHSCNCEDFSVEYTTHNVVFNEILPLSPESLSTLNHYYEQLSSLKNYRSSLVTEYEAKIKYIVDKLEEDTIAFGNIKGLSVDSLNIYRNRLFELEAIMDSRMDVILQKAMIKLNHLWEDLYVNEEQRQAFLREHQSLSKELTLEQFDNEIQRLNSMLSKAKPVIDMITQRIALCETKEKLDNPDPKRLLDNNKNSTFLLKEEKLRRKVKTELPVLTKKIYTSLKTWDRENGYPLLYNGENYMTTIIKEIEEEKKKKEEMAAKKELERSKRLGFKPAENLVNSVSTPLKAKPNMLKTPLKGTKTTMNSESKLMTKVSRIPLKPVSETPKPTKKRAVNLDLNRSASKKHKI